MSASELDPRFSAPNKILRPPTGSVVPHIVLMGVHLLSLAGPPFRYRRELVSVATIVLMGMCLFNPHFTNDFGLAQPFSIAWSTYLATLEKVAASGGPEAGFWRIDMPIREALAYPAFGIRKLRWALVLIFNMRGIRWNYQVKNIPSLRSAEKSSRARFVFWRLGALGYYLLMADLVSQAGMHFFYTGVGGEVGAVNSKFLTLRSSQWQWGFVKALVFGATPYYMVQMQYTAFSAAAVALWFSKPEDWPPSFGSLSEVTTLRTFWGKYWHQTLRRMFSAYTTAIVDALHIRRGRNLSSYIQLWLTFLISGLGHAASILVLPSPANITFSERTVGLVGFFIFQAAAITFEDFVLWLSGRSDASKSSGLLGNLLGYTWVVSTLWYSLPWAGDVYVRMRLGEKPLLPFTILGLWIKMLPYGAEIL